MVIEELKQRISNKISKLKCYTSVVNQYQQNITFKNNQKTLYKELDEKMRQEQVMNNAEDSIKFGVSCWKTQLIMTEILNG